MNRRSQMLEGLGIGPQWLRRNTDKAAAPGSDKGHHGQVSRKTAEKFGAESSVHIGADTGADSNPNTSLDSGADTSAGRHSNAQIAAMGWDDLQKAVSTCTRCALSRSRTRTVFGVGDPAAAWLFVGEGPGRNEDQQGEPFVGPAGKLLDGMLASMTLRRGRDAFIANIVKCRPTDASGKDRAPAMDEIAACRPYLSRQIALIKPAILIALGKSAALGLLECDPATAVSTLRGTVHRYGDLPLVVTYHPAYLLRMPVDKRKTWEDLCLAMTAHAGVG